MNNELCETRELITKYSYLLQDSNKKLNLKDEQIEKLKNKILSLKKKKKNKRKYGKYSNV